MALMVWRCPSRQAFAMPIADAHLRFKAREPGLEPGLQPIDPGAPVRFQCENGVHTVSCGGYFHNYGHTSPEGSFSFPRACPR
jgi:hypothetical protein